LRGRKPRRKESLRRSKKRRNARKRKRKPRLRERQKATIETPTPPCFEMAYLYEVDIKVLRKHYSTLDLHE
jgi:hypothetical protein